MTATTRFTAIFDGNGNIISNLFIARDARYIGLFGYIGSGWRGAAIELGRMRG